MKLFYLLVAAACVAFIFFHTSIQASQTAVHKIIAGKYKGSGVSVTSSNGQTLVLTANHVIKDGGPYFVSDYPAIVIASDAKWDLAALVVDTVLPSVRLSNTKPVLGDIVTLASQRSEGYFKVSGKVTGFVGPLSDPPDWLVFTGKGKSGDSGGPIFYVNGTVCAIFWGTDNTGGHGTHCLRVRSFLTTVIGYDYLIDSLDTDYILWQENGTVSLE